ncbi:MAG TPA: site-specific DNA-methyltransferase [Polyangiaceae bacterium]|nr:site-specific DNA-methyltransferase [Polyangiaceae bacterium]
MSASPKIRLHWENRPESASSADASLVPNLAATTKLAVVEGDNLNALEAMLPTFAERVALVYMDPPFFTGRAHQMVKRQKGRDGRPERTLSHGFDDRWESLEHYLESLWPRLVAARKLLRPDGCLVLHVDPKTSHYAKVMLDELFGLDCFASEIIWRYRRWPAKTANFQRVHDVLLRYVRNASEAPIFNQLYEPLAASTQATWGSGKQRAVFDAQGRRMRSSTSADSSPGTPMGDVWEIGIVAPVARERTGYPTQKPEALLQRLITACTAPGDLVIDPFLGSGTTLAAAAALGRRGIGIDMNPEAIRLTRERLVALGHTVPDVSHAVGADVGRPRKALPAVRRRVA